MKIVFMGTPDFAVPSLHALTEAGYEVAAVVTQPDKPKGRGKTLLPTPVKEEAVMHDIPVYQPEKVRNNPEFLEILKEINPEIISCCCISDRLFQKKSWSFRNLDASIFMRLFFRNTEEQRLSSRL